MARKITNPIPFEPRRPLLIAAFVAGLLPAVGSVPYPLDGEGQTGIRRLEGYRNSQAQTGGFKLPRGALLGFDEIKLNLAAAGNVDLTAENRDPALQNALDTILGRRDPSYAVTVVDITDPAAVVWASVREDRSQLPGSVGKLGVMIGLFDGLRRAFPDPAVRALVLKERIVVAEDWAVGDPHTTPHFDPETGRNRFSTIAVGERFSLAEWIDHMISASANSAGSTVWKEAMLLRQFGAEYPPTVEQEHAFFKDTPKTRLSELSLAVINEPLAAAGIDLDGFRQGTMFTKAGQRKVPGTSSYATPLELARILLRIEQGRMVDDWSSLEMKRYLYMTKKRYRYVYAPELADAAVYFKSGSFYKCRPEEGFTCAKYSGNVENLMNSVAIVESPAARGPDQKRYIVALLSNVLKVNSAWDHSRIAAAIEQTVRTRQPVAIKDAGTGEQIRESGTGD
jgi:hypothetical protein